MIETQTKAKLLCGIGKNCKLQDVKSPDLVLVSNLSLYSISIKLVFEAPGETLVERGTGEREKRNREPVHRLGETLLSRSFAAYLPSRQCQWRANFSKFLFSLDQSSS